MPRMAVGRAPAAANTHVCAREQLDGCEPSIRWKAHGRTSSRSSLAKLKRAPYQEYRRRGRRLATLGLQTEGRAYAAAHPVIP